DQFNELIMTRLRTRLGIDLNEVEKKFGLIYRAYLMEQIIPFQKKQLVYIKEDKVHITSEGKFLSDGIASDLFLLDLSELKKKA
ncbi:MAG: coproporphyrinogen III oxidase, partial [Flavobacteriaceae bacterium]|nr:coproporphyrinogen III oxidase [Flavobacteriaceae bacterium]